MDVILQYTDGCPNVPGTVDLLEQVLQSLAPGERVQMLSVPDPERAAEVGFLGSPSLVIDGMDLEGRVLQAGEIGALGCRIYRGGGGVPPRWMVEAAVLRALAPRYLLFLCVANSARSQLAEGIARSLAPAGVRVASAGSCPTSLRPEARAVLEELGLETSTHHAKGIDDLAGQPVEAVFTLCAEEVCPVWLGEAARVHWGLPDPADVQADPPARLQAFREVRDELRYRLGLLFEGWQGEG